MRNLKLTLQYDGTTYVGWQRQPSGPSIQALIEDALAPIEGKPVTVYGAGRTDGGVHALAQVASVRLEALLDVVPLGRALNAVLPEDVRVVDIEEVSGDFHARFSATGKTYEYRIVNAPFVSPFLVRYAWHVPQRMDVAAMQAAAAMLVGRHDFAAFQGAGSVVQSAERTIERVDWDEAQRFDRPLVMRVTGDGFLRHMVRNIAGTLVEVGCGRVERDCVESILKSRSRTQAGPTAPPQGLFLVGVRY